MRLIHRWISVLTHWGRVTHICVVKLIIIASDNGLSPGRRQAIIWINAGILLIGSLGTNFSEILIEILTFSFKKTRLKVSSAKRRPFFLGLNVLSMFPCHDVSIEWWDTVESNRVYAITYVYNFVVLCLVRAKSSVNFGFNFPHKVASLEFGQSEVFNFLKQAETAYDCEK